MTPDEQLKEFVTLVAEMRDLQTRYFQTRDAAILSAAKTKERRVDQYVKDFRQNGNSQPKLFIY